MVDMRKVLFACFALSLIWGLRQPPSLMMPAYAQTGIIGPGHVLGNATTSPRTATDVSIPSLFNQALCNTAGAFPVKPSPTSVAWQCSTAANSIATLNGGPLTINATGGNAALLANSGPIGVNTTSPGNLIPTAVACGASCIDVQFAAGPYSLVLNGPQGTFYAMGSNA